jgi:flagellin FlaB
MRRHRASRARRGTIGIETAIVMIAFVVVASAVAYVIINMGFYAAQKSKETIGRGVESASSSLELDGSVIGKVDSKASSVEYLIIPVRLSVGRSLVDLANNTVMVTVFCSNFTIADIYEGVLTENATWTDPPLEQVITYLNNTYYDSTTNTTKDVAFSVIYNDDGDTLLELNEKAFIVIQLNSTAHPLKPYDLAKVEVKIGTGAALTVVRQMPPGFTANEYVDLD